MEFIITFFLGISIYSVVMDKKKEYFKKSCLIITGMSMFYIIGDKFGDSIVYLIGMMAFVGYLLCDTKKISKGADYRDGFVENSQGENH